MGTKVQFKSYLPEDYSMNDLNDSNIYNWPLLYGDKSFCGPRYSGCFQTPTLETYVGGHKDVVKLTMLEHEAIFKNQVYELHRLYGIQRDMMDEIKRKELNERQMPRNGFILENFLPSQIPLENVEKRHFTSSNGAYSSSNRWSISGTEEIHSSLSPMKGNIWQVVKESERPTNSRKMLDLQLPADEYRDNDEEEIPDKKRPEMRDYLTNKIQTIESDNYNDKAGCSVLLKSDGFGNLNEPLQLEETNISSHASSHGETQNISLFSKPLLQPLDISREISLNSSYASDNATQNNHDGRGVFSNVLAAGNRKDSEKAKPILGLFNTKAGRKDGHEKSLELSFHKHLGGFSTSHLTNHYHASPNLNLNNRRSEKTDEALKFFDMNSPDRMNLNVVRSNSLSDRGTHCSAFVIKDGKAQNENHLSLIPCLKAMPSSMNGAENSSRLVNDGEISFAQSSVHLDKMKNGDCPIKLLSDLVKFGACSNDVVERKLESGSKKILGFTVFDESWISKNDSFLLTSSLATTPHPLSEFEPKNGRKTRALDINLPCDDPSVPDTETLKRISEVPSLRCPIDLNICLSDDEELFDIDLEASAIPESIENIIVEEVESFGDKLVKMAAEAIVCISSGRNFNDEEDYSPRASLLWFVDIVLNDESTTEAIDQFEAMTLSLREISEEEYMPKPPFPNDLKFEESVNFSQPRVRRGPSRRGRQRRAFQRDILPSLTSLTRHEVSEDLQTFSGLMRAAGHPYSGMTRRNSMRNNGGGRGRRRAVVTPSPPQNTSLACNNIRAGLDDRSLTGWGKTTRRPRRQRIPAANLNVVALS